MTDEKDNRIEALEKALKEALGNLHDLDENHPCLTRPDWSKDGVNLWTILKGK